MLLINKISHPINKAAALICGLFLLGITLFSCLDVFMSFIFNKPIPAAIELMTLTLPWVLCLGLAYGLDQKSHVRVSLVTSRFSEKNQLVLDALAHLFAFLFFCALTYGSWLHFWSSFISNEPMFASTITLPWWLAKMALPVGIFMIAAQHLIEHFESIRAIKLFNKKTEGNN